MFVPPGDQITNKMQTPVKSVCIEAILFRCYYIIDPKCCQQNWERRKKEGEKCKDTNSFSHENGQVNGRITPTLKKVF